MSNSHFHSALKNALQTNLPYNLEINVKFYIFNLNFHLMRDLLRQIKFYFTYHRKDKYGIIVLLVLCAILLIAPEIYYGVVAKQKIIDHINITNENFAKLVAQLEAAGETTSDKKDFNEAQPIKNTIKPIDINLATAEDLKQLKGIGEVFSKRIVKYRDSKNGFDNLEDLKDVYGISDSLYNALKPQLTFTATKKPERKNVFEKKKPGKVFEHKEERYVATPKPINPITVDINTASAEVLKQLKGIGNVLSKRIVKYRNSIGGFENIQQLKEVYGIEDSLYTALLGNIEMSKVVQPKTVADKKFKEETVTAAATTDVAYRKLKEASNPENFITPKKEKISKPPVVIDVNKAAASEFQQLNGIGNFRAKEIVSHREKLGGFYDVEQLKEVYSFNDSLYNALKPQLTITSTEIKKININTIEFKALLKHPYFDYNLTKHLINFRDNRNGLKSIEDLKESYLIDDALYKKLKMYLTVE